MIRKRNDTKGSDTDATISNERLSQKLGTSIDGRSKQILQDAMNPRNQLRLHAVAKSAPTVGFRVCCFIFFLRPRNLSVTPSSSQSLPSIHQPRSTFSVSFALARLWDLQYKKSRRCSSTIEVRLLRFLEARNIRRGDELMYVDMLLLDSKATLMPTTVTASRPSSPLPEECFRFRSQSELLGLANTNTLLPDIIGEFTAVKTTVSDPLEDKNHLMATIKMDKLEAMRVDPRVIIATRLDPKIVGAIVAIIFLRELKLVRFQRSMCMGFLTTLTSCCSSGVSAFYGYKLVSKKEKGPNKEQGGEEGESSKGFVRREG
ncbi:hypothetical protein Bca101_026676 [Brassica carinata]